MEGEKEIVFESEDKGVGVASSTDEGKRRYESYKKALASLAGECRPEILPFGGVCETPAQLQGHEEVANTVHARITADSNGTYIESGRSAQVIDDFNHSITDVVGSVRQTFSREADGNGCKIMITSHSPRTNDPSLGGSGPLESDEHCFTIDRTPHFVNRIRRLTPTECERLQGFPDSWTKFGVMNGKVVDISDSQRYKQCGNAITTNVVTAITTKLIMWFNEQEKNTKQQ
jgi:DNA (cytosine-5)-methyltransferase 1